MLTEIAQAGKSLSLPSDDGSSARILKCFSDEKSRSSEQRKRKKEKMDPTLHSQQEQPSQQPTCSKDQGHMTPQSVRSRGPVFVVRSGSHIDMFAPIYK